ncbi:MAG: hypothetical protein ACOX7C_08205 [Brevefilum sp.]
MKNRKAALIIILALVLVILVLLESSTHFVHRIIDDVLYDNYHHYLQCEDLPEITAVENAVTEHQETIREIESLAEGQVTVNVDASSCPGRGSIVIYFPSHTVREQIEDILGGRSFYGIPVTLINW